MSNPNVIPDDSFSRRQSIGRRQDDMRSDDLSRLLLQIPAGILCINRAWQITFANPESRRILDIHPRHIQTDILWTIFPDLVGTDLEHISRSVMHARIPAYLEYFSRRRDIWLEIHILPFSDGISLVLHDITDRKGAELLRDVASRQLLQVLEATTDAVVSVNREETFTFLNRRARQMLSAKGDLLGKKIWHEFPASSDQFRHHYDRAMCDGIASDFEDFYPEPLNLWLSIQIRPSDDGVVIFFRDITTRRKADQALLQQRDLLSIVQQTARVATWDVELSTGKITFGIGSYPVFGHPFADLPDLRAFRKFIPSEHVTAIDELLLQTRQTGEMIVTDFPIRAANGSILWIECRCQALIVNGVAIRLRGLALDISDRKTFAETLQQRQEETERQRAELETIYRTAPVGLALFDPVEFRYLRVNDRQAETIGLSREQIIGRSITEIAPLDGIEDLFRQVASGGAVRNHLFEGVLPTRPGEHRFWNVNYAPVHGSDGQVEAIAAVIQEMTHQKKAERALIQSEKLAAVGRLASSISHEINNPLEAITNLLYLIQSSNDLPPSLAGYVHTAQSELSRVCQIATQTLRFHRQAVSATWVTAKDLIDAVLNLYHGRLLNSGIVVKTLYATSQPILCFENDIRQVLNNLIANAIDAMRQGGRLIIRAHHATDQRNGHKGIRITIADTGYGMSPAVRARIFEPFYTTKDLNGTGLGLWISSGIVKRHQGKLTLRSTQHAIHHGTVFSLFLPHFEEPQQLSEQES
ncbi:PAS domain-containing sensor histidine kinase [Edaphobacter albus]|uniref:PAS domain-containing sensor histidine kinase n=1 Tax=Edaphobacter sp. 4G125 TaxID=2763071 RepID=UPI00164739BF|nr:PAS domain-containing protein [Edaphobacter sp. 4G125]QNI37405.1 PAS domain-containing protein [Edaphobacter sp. 4G125]